MIEQPQIHLCVQKKVDARTHRQLHPPFYAPAAAARTTCLRTHANVQSEAITRLRVRTGQHEEFVCLVLVADEKSIPICTTNIPHVRFVDATIATSKVKTMSLVTCFL